MATSNNHESLPSLKNFIDKQLTDSRRSLAKHALTMNYSAIKTERQFRHAFDCLLALEGVAGQVKEYREQAVTMRKTLEAYHKLHKWLLPDDAVKRLESSWRAICKTFQQHLSAEAWEAIEKTTTEAFSDVRKTLERSKQG